MTKHSRFSEPMMQMSSYLPKRVIDETDRIANYYHLSRNHFWRKWIEEGAKREANKLLTADNE